MVYVETLVKHLQSVGMVGPVKMADVSSSVQSCVLLTKPVYMPGEEFFGNIMKGKMRDYLNKETRRVL